MSYSNTTLLSLPLVLGFLWKFFIQQFLSRRRLPLPPGPKPLPLLGNVLDMPSDYPWLTYDKWRQQYGDIISLQAFGHTIVIIGSAEVAYDLFEKRSSIYSDRMLSPVLTYSLFRMGYDWDFAFMPYGDNWRRHRRVFHQFFNQGAIDKYHPVQMRESLAFVQRLLDTPQQLNHHIQQTFAATIMDIAYGIRVSGENDKYARAAADALASVSEAGVPGKFLVDLIPILKYVPAWVPGADFQKKAAYWRELKDRFINDPFKAVKDAINRGAPVRPSMLSSLLETFPEEVDKDEGEQIARNCAAIAYGGGADTTVSAVEIFFLAMLIYPDVQKKAQQELDSVVGAHRLPEFSDRNNLPYINALVKETMRWQSVTPLGVPHGTTTDDVYNGYFIPKGSIVFGNAWSILHDPIAYPQPEVFKPERFLKDGKLNPEVRDPSVAAFGFGRRICPGRHFSNNSLFILIALVLSTFDVTPPLDTKGERVRMAPAVTSGLLSHPEVFKCSITPRSKEAEALIREAQWEGV
ncbi:hypothetical protein JAAARDRAFT_127559 [Jaapia argillacea MUCL 33604]|uniref:Cytochrome P450 n=1 Tax=Jaapia argillacea MUCL 33604 TaxID=933084 RepID=A0A067Q942_9AGAM|nr:hypothetical protein JAAARDRAFT_127559 [Jaapia argillacea MUCL 33604]